MTRRTAARRLVAAQGEQHRHNSFSHSRFSCCHSMSLFLQWMVTPSTSCARTRACADKQSMLPMRTVRRRCSRRQRRTRPHPQQSMRHRPCPAPVLCEAGAAASTALPLPLFLCCTEKKCCTHTREMRANLVKSASLVRSLARCNWERDNANGEN